MGYFQVRYDSRSVNYDRRGFIRLATGSIHSDRKCFPVIEQYIIPKLRKDYGAHGGVSGGLVVSVLSIYSDDQISNTPHGQGFFFCCTKLSRSLT